jgi:hypothetical protein
MTAETRVLYMGQEQALDEGTHVFERLIDQAFIKAGAGLGGPCRICAG